MERSMRPEDPWRQWLDQHPVESVVLEDVLMRVEQYFLRWAWEAAQHNRVRACKLLGLAKVDQLRYLMRKYEIE
jgi:DNA-binding protein Fis